MTNHFIIRVGDGKNFINSSGFSIWGVKERYTTSIKKMKIGDKLWILAKFGKVIAVCDYESYNKRVLGPLLSLTMDNEELGWKCNNNEYNIEIHYTNLYNLLDSNVLLPLNIISSIILYKNVKNKPVNLIVQYEFIAQLLKPKENMFL